MLLAGTAPAQEGHKFRAWILSERALSETLAELPSADGLRLAAVRGDLWRRAAATGPMIAPLLLKRRSFGRDPGSLSILAALGLAGGPDASAAISSILESGRSVESRVVAALAAGRPNVRADWKRLRRLATDSKRELVVRCAARVALLCRGHGKILRQDLASLREPALEVQFWRSLVHALDGAAPVRRAQLRDAVAPDSLVELTTRAVLLDAVRHPGTLEFDALEALLRRTERPVLRRLASLALGRLGHNGREGWDPAAWLDASARVDRSCFLAGLDELPGPLRPLVMRGPGGARNDATKRRFRAAAVRLLPAESRREFVGRFLDENVRDLQEIDAVQVQPVLTALLRRYLVGSESVRFTATVRAQLRRVPGRIGVLLALLSEDGAAIAPSDAERLGPRLVTAVRLLRAGDLGSDAREGKVLLWNLVAEVEDSGGVAGPGSAMHVFVEELALLVHDLFVAAAQPGRSDAFLPEGIRLARKDYFAVLGEWLRDWPLPHRLPPTR